ncbi:hypothetical protein [Bacillus marinisedimentorum]|uniref:hypothetical protein n=1 Tax=Bacillus marinisedimentorum TaxID=1821260 RepID=UPI0012FF7899|nr:hypothetical protein [Bacillus marinisedimentorum]
MMQVLLWTCGLILFFSTYLLFQTLLLNMTEKVIKVQQDPLHETDDEQIEKQPDF